ncbi:MAG: nucleotidyltransferase domain-containing protein [Candidatus Eremiobacteraeota bacterium]|nr:nucleotidyltransferase domain-containing protein [Candidatus Eremiobacteraeota bacterium]
MLEEKAKACLTGRKNLAGAWLFGSQASGRAGPTSDVDIAVLGFEPLSLDERLELQLDLEDSLHVFDVDLVDLRRASVVLQFEALHGIRLFVRSPDEVARFSSLVGREYESAMALLQSGFRARKQRKTG